MEDSVKEEAKEQKAVTSWRKSTRIGDVEESVDVEKIANGFLISKRKSWRDKDKGYQSTEEKLFSEKNPLEKDPDAKDKSKDIKDLYTSMFGVGTPLTD